MINSKTKRNGGVFNFNEENNLLYINDSKFVNSESNSGGGVFYFQ